MRYAILATAFAAFTLVACDGAPTDPSVPSPQPTPPVVPAAPVPPSPPPTPIAPPTPGSPAFSLTISDFRISLYRRGDGSPWFQYEPLTLTLQETSGKSSATLQTIVVEAVGGSPSGVCTDGEIAGSQTIEPGKSRDLAKTMGYCMPYAIATSEISEVSFTAVFHDSEGRAGTVQRTVSVAGCTLAGRTDISVHCK